nr:hypothetical protein [Candidatus Minimicrobia vallesae]
MLEIISVQLEEPVMFRVLLPQERCIVGVVIIWVNWVTGVLVVLEFSATPVRINSGGLNRLPNNYSAVKLSTGGSRSQTMCVITTEKRAYCWGQARFGQLGIGVACNSYYGNATRVKELEDVTDISQDGYTWSGSSCLC